MSYNARTGDYVVVSDDERRAQEVGLTLSTSARGQNGERVWFTREPHAALSYWAEADGEARSRLQVLHDDYERSWAKETAADFPAPRGLRFFPFQRAGIEYAVHKGRALVGDEPGLGKTVQAIGIANFLEKQKVLVVCPGAVRMHWNRKIQEWSTLPRVSTYTITKSGDGVNPYANYVIVSYDLARNPDLHEALCAIRWDMVVSDETHYLKTPDAKRTQAVFGGGRGPFGKRWLAQGVENVVALTGTPLPNRPRECLGGSVKVLTNRGWICIVDVLKDDLLWDGIEWVKHDGLLYQGCAKTVSVEGIIATEAHLFLAKNSWVSAAEAAQNTDIVHQMLESGSACLPSLVWKSQSRGLSTALWFNVTAALRRLRQLFNACELEGLRNADLAVPSKELRSMIIPVFLRCMRRERIKFTNTSSRCVLTASCAKDFSKSFVQPFKDATTLRINNINLTEAEVSKLMNFGAKIKSHFSNILYLCRNMMFRVFNLIALITIKGTNLAILGGPQQNRTLKIAEDITITCCEESKNLRPVYDIANAGPRQRFTILSDSGPVISHNCFMIAKTLCPEAIDWMTHDQFCYRFNPSNRFEESTGRLPELQARLRCNFMVRRLKRDVAKDLPDKQWEVAYVEPNGAIRDALSKENLYDITLEDLKNPFSEIWGQISTVRREMGEAMAPRVVEHLQYLLKVAEIRKIVVFAHHRSVMSYIEDKLGRDFGVVSLRGGMSMAQKDYAVQVFQQPDGPRVFLGQMQAAGEGIDGLQNVASHVVFAEPAWVPKDNDQPLDRCHRIGQHENVVGQLMMVEGSLTERMLGTVVEKAQVIHGTLDDALTALADEGEL